MTLHLAQALSALVPALWTSSARVQDPLPRTTNPILFVTQVPVASDYLTVASTFGNHRPGPGQAPRGGDLWIRYPDGTLRNLTREAGFGQPDGFQGAASIAVREPCVHWSGTKAVFSMVVGSPTVPREETFLWQLYEVTGLAPGELVIITRVPNQPRRKNNVSPCYASDGRILFASDRTRVGQRHLYPQLDEYEEAPTTTGLWSLDPASGELFQMNHAPSGAFGVRVDAAGRVLFTRWDHLERDQQADLDRMGLGSYRTYNWSDESVSAVRTGSNEEHFPEPRPQWIDFVNSTPGYSGDLAGWEAHLAGNAFNLFLPWTLNQDGSGEETLAHVGRNELFRFVPRSRRDDPNVTGQANFPPWVANRRPLSALHQLREDPRLPGTYLGIDCREFDTHAAGQVVRLTARTGMNANEVAVDYVTHRDTQTPTPTPGPDHSGFYRNPLPLSGGRWLAAHTPNTQKERNLGTATMPRSRFDFRLKLLEPAPNGFLAAGAALTRGLQKRVQFYDPFRLVTYDGELWELDPVEVVARPVPPETRAEGLLPPERRVLAALGVAEQDLRGYLERNGLALLVSRNVTRRDQSDRSQPFNLRVPGGAETRGASGRVYAVPYFRLFQGDLVRGIENGIFGTAGGRRVLAQPLHDPRAVNPPLPGAPPGSVAVAADGSVAALVPARRALTWQLADAAGSAVVNERYWITLQPGEIRTCTSCHGVNELDQAGQPPPRNEPLALGALLDHLKTRGEL
jgi:hypothetical protein